MEVERDRAQANLERAGRELALNLRGFLRDLGMDEHANYRLEPLEERSTFVRSKWIARRQRRGAGG